MKNLNDITVVIVTYKTDEKIIFDCLKSINSQVKILIVENSKNFTHDKKILSSFPNTKVFCSGENLGYGKGNNYGLKLVETKYALILNPDVICEKDFFNNIVDVINQTKDFTIIGCQYLNDKIFMPAGFFDKEKNNRFKDDFMNNKVDNLSKVEWVTGCSMLINLEKFINKEIFDKNFFLYFEEIDLCKSVLKKGENIFTSQKLKIHHLGFKSSTDESTNDNTNLNKVREWHWMWSSFYFYKKHYGINKAIYTFSGKLIKSFLKNLYFSITFQQNKKNKYLYRFLGLLNSFLNKPSFFRGKF